MKELPKSITERRELNLRQGIKSSLSSIRSIIALVYTLYRCNNRKAVVEYSESYNGGQIKLHSSLESGVKSFLGIENMNLINNNPLFKSQMEALQVGIELMFKLGKVEFLDNTLASSAERTGGKRYVKRIRFGTNIQILDTFLSSYEADLSMFLNKWLNNQESSQTAIDKGLQKLLTIFSEETQFKIRYNNQEISFQQEGIYKDFEEGNTVVSRDEHENVGPFRVFKSYVKEGLHPYIAENGDEFVAKESTAEAIEYYRIVSTALDLNPKRTQITTYVSQNNDINPIPTVLSIVEQKQIIFYGAPGTGKSYSIKQNLQGVNKDNIIRTTFHPDSDYATFVGSYKPTMKAGYRYEANQDKTVLLKYPHEDDLRKKKLGEPIVEKSIEYEFIPQAFIKAYIKAYKSPEENVYLIIEEINRGNCAQIFGDLFQLLDRNEDGVSEYPIKADADLCAFLQKELGADSEGIAGEELCLPSNLYIWSTMNTSDQSLFPIDSAFKRRWDWEYIPIQYCNTDWKINIGELTYAWTDFQRAINDRIQNATNSEDKKIGDYFVNVKNKGGIISQDLLLNKIIFYLWNDVCKDDEGEIFRVKIGTDETDVTFSEFFNEANKVKKLQGWMNFLGVTHIIVSSNNEDTIDETSIDTPSRYQYSINNGESFQKTYLGFKTFETYVKLHPEKTINEMLYDWKQLQNVPKHLIETEEDYLSFLNTSKGDRKKNESRFEMAIFKEQKFYLWKGWGDGAQDNITAYMDAVNNAGWGIEIKRIE